MYGEIFKDYWYNTFGICDGHIVAVVIDSGNILRIRTGIVGCWYSRIWWIHRNDDLIGLANKKVVLRNGRLDFLSVFLFRQIFSLCYGYIQKTKIVCRTMKSQRLYEKIAMKELFL